MAAALDEVVHALKFGADAAAQLLRAQFPDVREPTQQIAIVAAAAADAVASRGDADAGWRARGQRAGGDRRVPSAPTRLKKAVARLTEPTLRAWRQRERRRRCSISSGGDAGGGGRAGGASSAGGARRRMLPGVPRGAAAPTAAVPAASAGGGADACASA